MNNVRERKQDWRRIAVEMFSLLDREMRRPFDALLTERVREWVFAAGAKNVLAFAPLPDEPDVTPFLRRWLEEGGRLAFPVWLGAEKMVARRVDNLDADLRPGRGGILEPGGDLPEAAEDELDLAIVPARFYSESCQRLGRGAGAYDAFFRRCRVQKVGVAYDFQVLPELPVSDADVAVDLVVTPSRLIMRKTEAQRGSAAFVESGISIKGRR